ncbi:MAG: hypothetical protein KGL36_00485 [Gammaproteobacteria bacterium]|nr:hypothetical protein [Gammaproteobacteria bacterium]
MSVLAISIGSNLVLGIVLFGLLYRRRGTDQARLADTGDALRHYRSLDPAARGRAILASDGRAAFVELDGGDLGLVERRGRRWAARALETNELTGVDASGDGTITLRFADFGWPRARVRIEDPVLRRRWLDRLGALCAGGGASAGAEVHDA